MSDSVFDYVICTIFDLDEHDQPAVHSQNRYLPIQRFLCDYLTPLEDKVKEILVKFLCRTVYISESFSTTVRMISNVCWSLHFASLLSEPEIQPLHVVESQA